MSVQDPRVTASFLNELLFPMTEPTPEQIKAEQVYLKMGLTPAEYEDVVQRLGRLPNLTETGIFGVMWSEHCSYKNSRPLLGRFPTEGPHVLQGPGEGAGVVDIGDGWAVVFKVESHNHPSAVEPHQGAATGVGGILRDIFSMGARPVAILNSLRFGPLQGDPRSTRTRYLLNHVVGGIAGYGNCIGVPTVGGEVDFHPSYSGNPLVNAMGVGLVRHDRIQHGRASGVGNPVIYVGAATGRDGIHGATFASEELNDESESKRPSVQVGDPFMGKLLLEACLECYETGALLAVQDMGAAGLTCSSTEMGYKGQLGMELNLDDVPQRAENMSTYEIMLSESQERMLFVAHPGREPEVFAICEKWGVPAKTVGHVIADPVLRLRHHGEAVAEVPLEEVCGNTPLYRRDSRKPQAAEERQQEPAVQWDQPSELRMVFRSLLQRPELASKAWVYRQYDSMVRTCTEVGPGSDAAVIRVEGTNKALAMSIDGNSRYVFLDPLIGGRTAVAECARNVVCAGARPLALTNGLNFGSPEKPEIFWQLEQAVTGMSEACAALKLPVTGGNVSLYNETEGAPILPTPMIGVVGLVEDLSQVTSQFFQQAGDTLMLVGKTHEELGGSAYQELMLGRLTGKPPELDLDTERALQEGLLEAIQHGWLRSAHDLSHGGLGLALLTCSTESLGVNVSWQTALRPDLALFSETQSRLLLSLAPEHLHEVEAIFRKHGLFCEPIGTVAEASFRVEVRDQLVLDESLSDLRRLWQEALAEQLEA